MDVLRTPTLQITLHRSDGFLHIVAALTPPMFHDTVYVNSDFRDLVLDTYPALRADPWLRTFFANLVFPAHVDKDTALPVLYGHMLASLEGRVGRWRQRHFSGKRSIETYQAATGHRFVYSRSKYQRHLARIVTDLNLDPFLAQALDNELRTRQQSAHEVTLAEGTRRTRQRDAEAGKADMMRASERQATYAVAQKAIAYLNALPRRLFSDAVHKHYEQAVAVALEAKDSNPIRAYQNLVTLRAMLTQPKPFYGPSSNGQTCRIFEVHRGLSTLSKNVAEVISQDWIVYDLRSSQLAIAAFHWGVPEMVAFLQSGESIWNELFTYLHLDPSAKRRLKTATYSLLYDARKVTIYRALAGKTNTLAAPLTPTDNALGKRLLSHPLMRAMYHAREQQLKQIRRDGEARARIEEAVRISASNESVETYLERTHDPFAREH